jgi:hypothetical protein
MFGRYGRLARVPAKERRHGIDISHPRYVQLPRIGTHLSPFFLYLALLDHVRSTILPEGGIDVIDAHVYYPDGVAAALLAHRLDKPVAVTARGTDLNHYPQALSPGRPHDGENGAGGGRVDHGLLGAEGRAGRDRRRSREHSRHAQWRRPGAVSPR